MNDAPLRTVEWKDKVIMIDQAKLSNELVFVEYDNFHKIADAISTLVVRGAPAIGVSIPFGLALATFQFQAKTKSINVGMNTSASVYYETAICPKTSES